MKGKRTLHLEKSNRKLTYQMNYKVLKVYIVIFGNKTLLISVSFGIVPNPMTVDTNDFQSPKCIPKW